MASINSSIRWAVAGVFAVALAAPGSVTAQGRGRGKEKVEVKQIDKGEVVSEKHDDSKSKKNKHVTTLEAVGVSREVLVANGFQVVNVVPTGTTQVIYYRRGNMGRGRGLGPIEKMYVVPNGQIVTFQSAPPSLLATILSRLGM